MAGQCIILGASHAGAQAAQSVRQEGWEGTITVIGDEPYLPYHRPPLSKVFLMGEKTPEEIQIRPQALYDKLNIEFKLSTTVTQIDRDAKTLTTADGETLGYDKLVLCTGSRPRTIPLPGSELAGVHYLRSISDVDAIRQSVQPGGSAVIIGGGYIGLETAAVLKKLGMHVSVLEMMDRVLQRVTCEQMSAFFTRIHTEEGVDIHTGAVAEAVQGDGRAERVICKDGTQHPADLVIIGVGIVPNVELAAEAGLAVENGIVVDECGRTQDPDVFAAGDCTNHPNAKLNMRVRLESVPNAVDQAKAAGAAVCGNEKPYAAHPWFWSDQYDIKLQIAGYNVGYDEVVIRGSQEAGRSFVAWYLKGGQMIAADCVNRPGEFMAARQILAKGLTVDPADLINEAIEPKTLMS